MGALMKLRLVIRRSACCFATNVSEVADIHPWTPEILTPGEQV